ncbi:MAG: class I SAM-dependent methyltransferase [Gammaproteobacteria bacterium]|nr:class I SAM-dependent methyltransferase [Gammaproteobacteria bacterium]
MTKQSLSAKKHPETTLRNSASTGDSKEPQVPDYLVKTYWWAYLHPRSVQIFERQWIVNLILWGNFSKLRDSALDAIGQRISGRTLQVACVYGNFTQKLAQRLSPGASLDVIDVAPIQLENLQKKLKDRKNVALSRQNASNLQFEDNLFDQVVLFFLLHELPEDVRAKTVREVLRVVKPGGKIVFVDYHRPVRLHPHRYIMRPILRYLEPYALDLWQNEITSWLTREDPPVRVEKQTYFGGLYQKVVMTR